MLKTELNREITRYANWQDIDFWINLFDEDGFDIFKVATNSNGGPYIENQRIYYRKKGYPENGKEVYYTFDMSIRKIKSIRLAKPSDYGNYTEE